MSEYYFKTIGQEPDTTCVEVCKVRNNGIRIGSVKCQMCDHCKEYDNDKYGDVSWIKCDVIDQAKQ